MEENPWLVYSKQLEGGLAKFCVLFDEKDSNRGIFAKRAFQDVGKPERIREHAQAKYHNETVTLTHNFVMPFEDPTKNVDYDPKKQERYDKNVHVLERIIQAKAVAMCAQQGLALRGHRKVESEDNEDSRDDNFQAILKSFAEIDPLLKDHLQHGPKNSQTRSWKIQNEIKNCVADCVRKEIIKQIQDFKHYAIIADEVTDRYSNKEILLLCIRYLNCTKERPAIREAFLASTHISGRPIGENIGQHILDLLDSYGIMIEDCRGQAYDDASAMPSVFKGASAVIKKATTG